MPPAAASETHQPMLRSIGARESRMRMRTGADMNKEMATLPMLDRENPQRRSAGPVPTSPEYGATGKRLPTTNPIPIPKPTVSAWRHYPHHGSAGAVLAARRSNPFGARGTKNSNNHNTADPFAECFEPRNTWPRNGGTRARRAAGGGVNPPDRSPLSIYGDGALHSFTVCGAPGCQVCSNGTGARQSHLLIPGDVGTRHHSDKRPERKGRRMIQHACANCRMPYIPKADPEGELRHAVHPRGVGAGAQGGVEVSGGEGLAGRGTDAADGPRPAAPENRGPGPAAEESSRWHQPASSSAAAPVTSSASAPPDDEFSAHEPGFCSGECKLSYMLTNPVVRRRQQRAAAVAKAAARAAITESNDMHRRHMEDFPRQSRPPTGPRLMHGDLEGRAAAAAAVAHARD